MGLFDFAKDVGRQLFDTDAEAADTIKEHLEIRTSGISNIEVEYDDGVATICGDCINQATKDHAVLMVGNIKGVEKVIADDLRVSPSPAKAPVKESAEVPAAEPAAKAAGEDAPEEEYDFYEIVSGDTLGKIAERYYGKASEYMRIFEANREIIEDPDRIYPGQKIRIPKSS
jgi:nucleoid-associated protein YgaU